MAGISLILQNNPNVTEINCGTSSPRLSGSINISQFPNLTGFTCTSNDINNFSGIGSVNNLSLLNLSENKLTSFPSFNSTPALKELRLNSNLFTGSIPSLNNLTGLVTVRLHQNPQISGNIPDLSLLKNLQSFYCIGCKLTGPIPSLTGNKNLKDFRCDSQISSPKINGLFPNITGNTALQYFYCHNNQISGSIPELSYNTVLQSFYCYTNLLTGLSGSSVSNTLGNFQAQNNQLQSTVVNQILAAFVAAGRTTGTPQVNGTCILNVGGAGNFSPTGQGITDVTTLRNRGWTVTTGTL